MLFFDDEENLNKIFNYWKINRESAKTSLSTTILKTVKYFRSSVAESFLNSLRKMHKAKEIQNEKAKQKK